MNRIIPISFPTFPKKRWFENIGGVFFEASISTDSLGISPGATVTNIVAVSKALPGIRKIRFEPEFWDDYFFPFDDTVNTYSHALVDSVRKAVKFNGWTVGPTAPPMDFIATAWCDTLRSYIHQSHTLGWINNTRDDDSEDDENAEDGIVKNLDKRLEKVRIFIVQKKYDKAQQQLEKFLNKVEKLWNRQQKEEAKNKKNPKIIFTSEVYALLKYNAEYLQEHLPGKK
jgi:hypothetical protein